MKRTGVIVCLIVMALTMLAPACFAAKTDTAAAGMGNFKIESSTPDDGAKGVSVENLSVKIYFDTAMLPKSDAVRKANAKQFALTDNKGKKLPIKVYYSHKEEGLLMVVSDNVDKDVEIKGNTQYKLTIGDGLQATNGSKFGKTETISFKTLDQSKSTTVYMIMMGVMIVGMVFFTSRSAKKEAEKQRQESKKSETVNPYKEAKKTGKSVEEIVRKDAARKAKEAEKREKQRKIEEELEEEIEENESGNKRVPKPRPISAAGSEYKVEVKTTQPQYSNKGTTHPKNGKKKNSKKKGSKK